MRPSEPPVDPLSRHQALLSVSSSLASHRTIAELFRVLADSLHLVVPFDYLALVLHDAEADEMRLAVLEPADVPPPPFNRMPIAAQGPAAMVWQTQRAVVIPVPVDGPLAPALDYIRSVGGTVTCWLPLTTAHGRLGVLTFGSFHATDYPEDATTFMEQVAAHVAVAVDNGLNFDQSQKYEQELKVERDRLRLLIEINNLLVTELQLPAILKVISESLRPLIEHEYLSLALYDRDSAHLRVSLTYDESGSVTCPDTALPLDGSPAGVTFERRVTTVFNRSELNAFGSENVSTLTTPHSRSLCCVPLVARHGRLGTLNIAKARSDTFSQTELDLLNQASVQITIAVENALAYRAIADSHEHLLEEKEYLEHEIRLQNEFGEIIGASAALKRVLKAVKRVAPTDSTVLLLGETGTGKELIARAIHNLSRRRSRTFVRLSGAALPTGLLESELFGYEKGAFTGATTSKIGRLELAHGGTLFLDEVGDIPVELQPKLLRVLQEREFERLGSSHTRRVDIRVVAATSRDLDDMIEDGSFRSDLYYRLNVFPIQIPPLRERVEDIPALAQYFTDRFARRMRRPVSIIPRHVMDALCRWRWPGNIRELENVIERAVILSPGPELQVPSQDLQPKRRRVAPSHYVSTLHDVKRETIVQALRESDGVVGGPLGAAARLGVKRTTLQSLMSKLRIKRPSY